MIESAILPGLLALMMIGVGLDMRPGALPFGAFAWRSFAVGLLGVAIVLPVCGVAIAVAFDGDPALKTGLLLLAISPVGLLASPLTGGARGNAALALALTMAASLIYIVLAPPAIGAMLGMSAAAIGVPADLLLGKIALVTLVPVLLGVALGMRFRVAGPRASRAIGRMTGPALLATLGWIVFDNRTVLIDAPTHLLIAILSIDLFAVVAAVVLARLFRLPQGDRAAILFAHLMRQEGTGIFVAVSILALPAAAMPLIANTVIGLVVCGIVWLARSGDPVTARIMRRIV